MQIRSNWSVDTMDAFDWIEGRLYNAQEPFDLALFSTPYPGKRGWKEVPTWGAYLDWWSDLFGVLEAASWEGSVIASVIRWHRELDFVPTEFWDIPRTAINSAAHQWGLLEAYVWDQVNPPPRGDLRRFDHPGYEMVWVFARKPCARKRPWRQPYQPKSVSRVTQKGGRGSDVAGSLSGGHTRLHPGGAVQPNIIRAPLGRSNRPRVKGGVFPYSLAERIIYQYTNEGDLVIDPFCGSGTVAVEALKQNRRFAGCDIDPKAVEVALNHIESSMDAIVGKANGDGATGTPY